MPEIIEPAGLSLEDRAARQVNLVPIRDVARLTGVNPVTLRAWERRYGLIQPTRTESGHRLYSESDIRAIRSILGWIARGVPVGKVGQILARTQVNEALSDFIPDELVQADYAQWQGQIRTAMVNYDDLELTRIYGQVFSTYAAPVVFQNIFMPVWSQALQHKDHFARASEWVMLDAFLRSRVMQRLMIARGPKTAQVAVAGIEGHCLELELLLAGLYLSSEDITVRVLALGNPIDELTLICEKIQPQALVLVSNRAPASDFMRRLNRLAMSVDCQTLLAGSASELAQDKLAGSSIGCLGNEGMGMRQRLQHFLGGTLDT
ncbi:MULTISPECIES: MerR family transcriptional regulator [Pseudomonas]|uniref:MerR family transcriptional regulator n=1 Tax=Pseudomonas TaxID=286 RepID=UPI000D00AF9C|nr:MULTISPECIES: MerR family transcriptional regulator [Pseudomonas]PRA51748.1 helix-turn-helix-type transcriptional regulator [Pseudomonas sp. MYb115]QXN51123.1 MerR family transcriptional regulator [Pseudomonas fluorescens]WSO25442.1 MerR family transcriptional regulator [Pseudomonas fluorescens]